MRTTLDVRDDVLEQVRAYPAARSISQGSAASELIERGLRAEMPTVWENGLLVLDPGSDAQVLTLEKTLELEDAIENDFARLNALCSEKGVIDANHMERRRSNRGRG